MKGAILSLALIVVTTLSAQAADVCKAIALHDVPALKNPTSTLKKGELDTAITQYRINKKTGEGSFCSHGGYCYPTHVQENGNKVEALKLTNCQVGKKDDLDDPEEIYYSVDVTRSKVGPSELKRDDVDNRLLELGLCSGCASNAAHLYVFQPQSPCARLVREVLEGNPDAVKILSAGPAYCEIDSTPERVTCVITDPTGTPLNVRTAPYGRVLGAIANGKRITIVDRTKDNRGRNWVYIADQNKKPLGWVFRDYVDCR
ncbi:SH3 domain-containing protein [Bradyrhizobium sp. Rc2d]|uniref:SH3 domain-containing protein n=1 Tax=Bradyrhizobium sp. Rc2d TaxID=1855321 RepID=UPI00159FA497|nr:SH3 domain-containing protein [Bradyrhizobium sp. Rc2d]